MKTHLEATQEQGRDFYQMFHDKGKIVMLNMLKFRQDADYEGLESIRPIENISGRQAYELYMELTMPFLIEAGSSVRFFGDCQGFLIGPESEKWDAILLVEHLSVKDFMAFAQNEEYLKIAGHRTAALEDSRLLPISETHWL